MGSQLKYKEFAWQDKLQRNSGGLEHSSATDHLGNFHHLILNLFYINKSGQTAQGLIQDPGILRHVDRASFPNTPLDDQSPHLHTILDEIPIF